MANTMTLLSTTTVGAGGASSVTFSNIPQTYTDLVIKVSARNTDTGATYFSVIFNNDTSTVYSSRRLEATGSAAASYSASPATSISANYIDSSTYTANTFSNSEIYIPNYVNSNYKSASIDSVSETNATAAYMNMNAGLYGNTTAITRIDLTTVGNFAQYSTFTLYGVFNADVSVSPSAPSITSATDAGGGGVAVALTNNGAASASYTVTSSPGGFTATGQSPVTVYGLSPATAYTFTAVANNPIGSSPSSSASSSVTPYKGYVALATVDVGAGGASSISFSSIDQNYSHLQIRWIARTNRSAIYDSVKVRLNSDTGSNYTIHRLIGDGATASSDTWGTNPQAFLYGGRATSASSTSGMMGAGILDILDYANTSKNKTSRSIAGVDTNSSTDEIGLYSGSWMNTGAITSISLFPDVGTQFVQYSSFTLYGVK